METTNCMRCHPLACRRHRGVAYSEQYDAVRPIKSTAPIPPRLALSSGMDDFVHRHGSCLLPVYHGNATYYRSPKGVGFLRDTTIAQLPMAYLVFQPSTVWFGFCLFTSFMGLYFSHPHSIRKGIQTRRLSFDPVPCLGHLRRLPEFGNRSAELKKKSSLVCHAHTILSMDLFFYKSRNVDDNMNANIEQQIGQNIKNSVYKPVYPK